jgi:hypothetical protein
MHSYTSITSAFLRYFYNRRTWKNRRSCVTLLESLPDQDVTAKRRRVHATMSTADEKSRQAMACRWPESWDSEGAKAYVMTGTRHVTNNKWDVRGTPCGHHVILRFYHN